MRPAVIAQIFAARYRLSTAMPVVAFALRRHSARCDLVTCTWSSAETVTSHSGGGSGRSGRPYRACQPPALVAVRETGLMWANMLRAFHVGNALTSDGEPSSWMRPSRVAWAHASWPACHLTKASASAVM